MKAIIFAKRPVGALEPDTFEEVNVPMPSLEDGMVLLKTRVLSIDPYQRGLLEATPLIGPPQPLGQVMAGRAIAEVVEGRSSHLRPGDLVVAETGWQEFCACPASTLQPIAPQGIPYADLSRWLGVLGAPGVTAWLGLETIGWPREGETVLVSSAAGAVGSVVAQLALRRGAHVIASAGGPEKARLLTDKLGVHEVCDYKAYPSHADALGSLGTRSIDVFFDNVGEDMLDAVLPRMSAGGRVLLCGYVSAYDRLSCPESGPRAFRLILKNRLRVQGFLVRDHAARFAEVRRQLGTLLESGDLVSVETSFSGLGSAPSALAGLLKGRHVGKTVVRIR